MARKTVWYVEAGGEAAQASGATDLADLLADARVTVGILTFRGHTVTRIIGDIYFRADAVPSGDNPQEVAFGIAVFNSNFPAGNHPNPRNENTDWMWQRTIRWVPWTVEASAGVFRQLMQVVSFDIRTQRVLRATEDRLELVVSNIGGEAITWDVRCRTLLRSP